MGVALVSLDVSGSGTYVSLTPFHICRGGRAGWLARLTTTTNQNVQEFGDSLADVQGMSKEILEIGQKYKEPNNFQEAWNHPDLMQRKL